MECSAVHVLKMSPNTGSTDGGSSFEYIVSAICVLLFFSLEIQPLSLADQSVFRVQKKAVFSLSQHLVSACVMHLWLVRKCATIFQRNQRSSCVGLLVSSLCLPGIARTKC